jgi:HK97 family phage portal protein
MATVQIFSSARRAVNAARNVEQALDLYESMWKPSPAAYTVGLGDIPGLVNGSYGLDTAMMVPAFARGMNVITGVASGLPLVDRDPQSGAVMQPYALTAVEAMWPGHTNVELMRVTITDLVAHGTAYWRVLRRNANGHPEAVDPITPNRVQVIEIGVFLIDGHRVWVDTDGMVHDNDVIRFSTGAAGVLEHGWMAIRTALSLEAAANNYALAPMPSAALKSSGGADLDKAEAEELLNAWEQARRTRATAYLNSQVDIETFGWNASELQLVEARQHAAVEIARMLNLDPYWVGATAGAGSSLTYTNRTDLYTGLLDFTILPLLRTIEGRLSMADVCGRTRQIRFNTAAFLRANLSERVTALTQYVAAGIITPQQAADMEPLIQQGEIPA